MADDDFSAQPDQSYDANAKQLILDIEGMLQRPEGRRVFMWLLGLCDVYGRVWTGDAPATDFNLGKRDIGLRVISKLNEVSPSAYPQLMLETADDRAKMRKPRVLDDDQSAP